MCNHTVPARAQFPNLIGEGCYEQWGLESEQRLTRQIVWNPGSVREPLPRSWSERGRPAYGDALPIVGSPFAWIRSDDLDLVAAIDECAIELMNEAARGVTVKSRIGGGDDAELHL